MKKLFLGLVVIILIGVGVAYVQLDNIVKVGVETGGPETLKVPVTVESVSLSPFSGKVAIKGLEIGQPQGYGEGKIASVGSFDMKLRPSTLMSDHIIIDSIVIDAPMLDARRIDGKTNFERLQQNVGPSEETAPSNITLTIKSMQIRGAQVAVKNEGSIKVDQTIQLADFNITDLGTDEKGLAPAEIARHIMAVLQPQITQALIKAGASDKLKDIASGAEGKLEEGLSSLVGKLKKKKDDQN
ncbi:AsmA family protein [Kordiimonas lacus]|uniref:AsmA family protein n=1 Tax=Kordiimonas lacus TaxID=637679 RepID=A0A1G6XVV2_9PROT|nr:AsmA family protein [Kordiimonas lacus]SDD82318.1 AsmA family protein [Kordiimonas lacus]